MIRNVIGLFVLAIVATACNSEPTSKAPAPEPKAAVTPSGGAVGAAAVTVTPGVAGGTVEHVVKATATVTAVDATTRKVTLQAPGGPPATFTASDAVRNFDQLKVGDKVNATLNEQLVVLVGPKREPGTNYGGLVARAPKGAKPGAIAAEVFEVVAEVSAIDTASRKATLKFDDGQTVDVDIRPDVDLSKYKVGDSVTIRVTQQLSLLVETP
jgi:Cu/Ag efflux protein CusF